MLDRTLIAHMDTHPLIRPAAWHLTVGAASAPLIKWTGAVLWAAAAWMALAWLAGLIQDAFAGQLAAWIGALGSAAVMVWLVCAWQVVQRWLTPSRTLTLTWHGPVRVADAARNRRDKTEGGFRVKQWQSPVQVRVVFDWQGWLLLRLRTSQACNAPQEAFCWQAMPVSAGDGMAPSDVSMHQLRSLLYLPPALITLDHRQPSSPVGQASHRPQPMASWSALVPSGSKLPQSAKTSCASPKSSHASREMDSLFPPTELLEHVRSDEHVLSKVRA